MGQEDTGHENLSVLLRGIASSSCGKRNSWKSLWPLSWPCPCIRRRQLNGPGCPSPAHLIFSMFSHRNLFLICLEVICCKKKITTVCAGDIQSFQSEIVMEIFNFLQTVVLGNIEIFFRDKFINILKINQPWTQGYST